VHTAGLAIAFAVADCGDVIRLGDGTSTDGGAGANGCQRGQVAANEVLWIGDSWVLVTGSQHTRVRDLARAANAIGPNDDYSNSAVAAATMADIAGQYVNQEAGTTKVKVLIMDGGGWDLYVNAGSAATVTSVVDTFKQHLATVASDGTVQQIIYYLVPDVGSTNVAGVRQSMQQACAASPVPCYFLDLQPRWAGHPEYSNGIVPSDSGAQVIADAIWAVMQQNCIAQ
jgi:hypothetical protein